MPAELRTLLGDIIKKNASDLHLSVGMPPAMRIDGELHYIDAAGVFSEPDVERALQSVLTNAQMERYKIES